MKRLIIASVMALSAGAASAQSTSSDIEQIGGSNGATVTQQLNGGTSNTSYVYQGSGGDGDASNSSQATVTQNGAALSKISSTVQQNDSSQIASVTQNGAAGSTQGSTVTQSNSGNNATVQQTASADYSQQSTITQSGMSGVVSVTQAGANDNSQVSQTGSYNNLNWTGSSTAAGLVTGGVNVNQSGAASNTSIVSQANNYSGILVKQEGVGGSNLSTVNQNTGQWDTAGVYQTAGAGISNSSTINQGGSGANFANVRQH